MKAHYVRLWRRIILACVGGVSVAVAIVLQFSHMGIADLRSATTIELLVLFGLIVFPALTMLGLRLDRQTRRRHRRLQAS
ncbi:MAG: hypothetical protein NXI14_06655 [bacterium]|nr:hypothetical protein [bacterium]